MKNIAIILAAGSGSRFASGMPKQFLPLGDKMLIEHSLCIFQQHPDIDEIRVAVQEEYLPLMTTLKDTGLYPKLSQIVIGGKERYESTLAVINSFSKETEANLLLHDAARPFITTEIVTEVVSALQQVKAVVVAIPVTDTMLEVSDEGSICRIPDRSRLWHAQTPQAFRLSVIRQAFQLAMQDVSFKTTDDSGVLFRYLPQEPILIVKGNIANKKITYQEDMSETHLE